MTSLVHSSGSKGKTIQKLVASFTTTQNAKRKTVRYVVESLGKAYRTTCGHRPRVIRTVLQMLRAAF